MSSTMQDGRVAVGTTDGPQHMPGHLSLTAGVHVLVFSDCVSQLPVTKHLRSLRPPTHNKKRAIPVCVCRDSDEAIPLFWAFCPFLKGSALWEHIAQQNQPQARSKEEKGESKVPGTPLRGHPSLAPSPRG